MKARMERLETRSAFRSSGILPPRRPPAAPLSPGEPRRRFLGVGGPLLPWIGRREGDEGARGAPFLPPPRERSWQGQRRGVQRRAGGGALWPVLLSLRGRLERGSPPASALCLRAG